MNKDEYLNFRTKIQNYILSMIIFKNDLISGYLNEELYELIEVYLANKYGLSRRSVIRDSFKLNQYKNIK